MFGGNYAPVGWAFCDGSSLSISQNAALFGLIGTTYGGDGQTTFKLPDLRGRAPVHIGANLPEGKSGGIESVSLTAKQIPAHTHQMLASDAIGTLAGPGGNVLGRSHTPNVFMYLDDVPNVTMA